MRLVGVTRAFVVIWENQGAQSHRLQNTSVMRLAGVTRAFVVIWVSQGAQTTEYQCYAAGRGDESIRRHLGKSGALTTETSVMPLAGVTSEIFYSLGTCSLRSALLSAKFWKLSVGELNFKNATKLSVVELNFKNATKPNELNESFCK